MKCRRCFYWDAPAGAHICEQCSRNFGKPELGWLLVLILTYALVGRLAHYIYSGCFFSFSDSFGGYCRHVFSGSTDFLFPLDVAKWHGFAVLLGVIFAFMAVVPAAAALLYGSWAGSVMVLIGSALSPFAFFSIPGILGCILSGSFFLRQRSKYAAIVIGAMPGLMYFLWSSVGAFDAGRSWKYLVPLLVAVAVCLAWGAAVVSSAAYRHWKATFLNFSVPVVAGVAFIWLSISVGFDRLEYLVLVNEQSVTGAWFRPTIGPERILKIAPWDEARAESAPAQSQDGLQNLLKVHAYFNLAKSFSFDAFGRYAATYSASSFAAGALYQQAEIANAMLDIPRLKNEARFSVYTDRVNGASVPIYEAIQANFHASLVAPMAYLKTADYYFQKGQFEVAVGHYKKLVDVFERELPLNFQPSRDCSVEGALAAFGRQRRPSGKERLFVMDDCIRHARRMIKIIEGNGDYDGEPLRRFAAADRRLFSSMDQINAILDSSAYKDASLTDVLLLEKIRWKPVLDPSELESLAGRFPSSCVADSIFFYLGEAYFRGGQRDENRLEPARQSFQRVIDEYPDSIHFVTAQKRLSEISSLE